MADRPVTLIEAVHQRTGSFLATGHVVAYVQAWDVAARALGREPTVEEYAAYWKQPVRSAYREQARFRKAFPEFESPAEVLAAAKPAPAAGRSAARPA